ncbi:MAG: hypothetical protein IT289_12295 [Oligoflexia bacterium]|nr:hypothetical protein [Oligoflexia bacterium]
MKKFLSLTLVANLIAAQGALAQAPAPTASPSPQASPEVKELTPEESQVLVEELQEYLAEKGEQAQVQVPTVEASPEAQTAETQVEIDAIAILPTPEESPEVKTATAPSAPKTAQVPVVIVPVKKGLFATLTGVSLADYKKAFKEESQNPRYLGGKNPLSRFAGGIGYGAVVGVKSALTELYYMGKDTLFGAVAYIAPESRIVKGWSFESAIAKMIMANGKETVKILPTAIFNNLVDTVKSGDAHKIGSLTGNVIATIYIPAKVTGQMLRSARASAAAARAAKSAPKAPAPTAGAATTTTATTASTSPASAQMTVAEIEAAAATLTEQKVTLAAAQANAAKVAAQSEAVIAQSSAAIKGLESQLATAKNAVSAAESAKAASLATAKTLEAQVAASTGKLKSALQSQLDAAKSVLADRTASAKAAAAELEKIKNLAAKEAAELQAAEAALKRAQEVGKQLGVGEAPVAPAAPQAGGPVSPSSPAGAKPAAAKPAPTPGMFESLVKHGR